MLKKLGFQKGLKNISVDSASHIKLKKTNLSLVVLRPNDLAQMGDLIGMGNRDIILWIGKTVGRNIADTVDKNEKPKGNEDFFNKSLKILQNLGFGICELSNYNESLSIQVKVENPIYEGLEENQEIISTIYIGIFSGLVEYLGYATQGTEIEAAWKDESINHSTFEIQFMEAEQ